MLPGTHFIKIDTSELLPFYYFQLQSVLQDSKSLQRFSKDFCPTTGGKKPSLFKLLNFKKRFIVISFAEDRPVGSLVTKKKNQNILTMNNSTASSLSTTMTLRLIFSLSNGKEQTIIEG